MGKLSISAKCSDLFSCTFFDENNKVLAESGEYSYVPENIGIGGGDYVELVIDTETGQILDWKPLSDAKVIKSINNEIECHG